jgi:iron complex outermembrane recepter protein
MRHTKLPGRLRPLCSWMAALAASLAALVVAPNLRAEGADASADKIEEIVVTARRRAESSQTVPLAITAINQEALDRQNVQTLTDLQNIIPSAYVSQYAHGSGQQFFSLRGQSESGLNTGGGAGGGPAVVGYFSEVPTQMSGPGLYYDLQSVEVLNGPQGTLFGRNTTGGAVLFEPRRPNLGASEGYVEFLGGDYRRGEAQGAVNMPLMDGTLAIRVAGQMGSREGYTRDVNTGVQYDNRHFRAARVGVLYQPLDALENYFIASYADFNEHGPGSILIAANPQNPFLGAGILTYLDAQTTRGPRATALSVRELDENKYYGLINKTKLNINSGLALANIFSFSRQQARRNDDEDGTTLPLLDSLGSRPGTYLVFQNTLTEELQLQGKSLADALSWQTGVYYQHDYTPGAHNHTYTQDVALLPIFSNTDSTDVGGTSLGAYGQATYSLARVVKGLSLTAGYRYTWDHVYEGYSQSFGAQPFYPAVGDFCSSRAGTYPDCFVEAGARHGGGSYTFGLDYRITPDTLLYLTSRQGYKSGGFNIVAASIGATNNPFFTYAPEKVRDVEVGMKADWGLGELKGRTNLALYNSWLTDAQVNTSALFGNLQEAVTANAAKAIVRGFELQNTLRWATFAEIDLTYSRLDAHYQHYVTPLGQDLTDLPYAFAPRNKGSVGGRVKLPLPAEVGEAWMGATFTYQDRVFAGFSTVDPGSYLPSYGLLGLRADWQHVWNTHVDLALFTTNLTNKIYRVGNEDLYSTIGTATTVYGEPRMYGASVTYQF